jgi:hypothetical protein
MKVSFAACGLIALLLLPGCVIATVATPESEVRAGPEASSAAAMADVPPGKAVPQDMRVYSGVWVGKWDGVWDTAIIVRQIHPDGVVDLTYRWVDHLGEPYSTGRVTTGKIDGGVLQFSTVRLTVDPSDPDTAHGDLLHAQNDAHRVGRFRRVS